MSLNTNIAQHGVLLSGIKARTPFDNGHWEIHGGKSFVAETAVTKMAVADYVELGFKTPAAPTEIHMAADFQAKLAAHLSVYENCNWSGGLQSGEIIQIFNRKRDSANTSTLLIDYNTTGFLASGYVMTDLTGFGGGTLITDRYSFGAKNEGGNPTRGRGEFILQAGKKYNFKLISDAAANTGQLRLNWYEQ